MPITQATANVVTFASRNSQIIASPGDNLATKYAEAAALTPQGNALSATNRATLIINPGVYTLTSIWTIGTEFVDICGLCHQFQNPAVLFTGFQITVTANDVRITGIGSTTHAITTSGSLPLNIFQNCRGLGGSFGSGSANPADGTYIGCFISGGIGVVGGFGYNGSANGTFKDCKIQSKRGFAGGDTLAFNVAAGIFTGCESTAGNSFGSGGGVSGTITSCNGGGSSFGFGSTITGKLYFCRIVNSALSDYPGVTGSGIIRVCFAGNDTQKNVG